MQRALRGRGGGVLLEAALGPRPLAPARRVRARGQAARRHRAARRADSFGHGASFAVARALCEQLLDALPDAALALRARARRRGHRVRGAGRACARRPRPSGARLALRPYPDSSLRPSSSCRTLLAQWLLRVSPQARAADRGRRRRPHRRCVAGAARRARAPRPPASPLLWPPTAASPLRPGRARARRARRPQHQARPAAARPRPDRAAADARCSATCRT